MRRQILCVQPLLYIKAEQSLLSFTHTIEVICVDTNHLELGFVRDAEIRGQCPAVHQCELFLADEVVRPERAHHLAEPLHYLDLDSGQLGRFLERVDLALRGAPGEVVEPIERVGAHRLDDGLKVDAAAQEELDEPDALDVVEGQVIACVVADDPARAPIAKALLRLAGVAR